MEAWHHRSGERAWVRSLRIVWDRAALFWSPESRLRRLCLGHRLLEAGSLEAARRAFAEVARLWPDEPEAAFGLGCVQHRLGRPAEALRLLTRATEMAGARWARIGEELGLGASAPERAKLVIGPAAELKEEAWAQWASLRQAQADVGGALRHREAAELLQRGELESAMGVYEELAARADAPAAVLNNLAWLYCTHSRDPEHGRRARALAERARALEPWSDEVLGTLGVAHLRSGDPAAAVEVLAPLVARRPELAQSSGFLAEARARMAQAAADGSLCVSKGKSR